MIKIDFKVGYFGTCPICNENKRLVAVRDNLRAAESYDERLFVCQKCASEMFAISLKNKQNKGKEFKTIFL